VLAAAFTGGTGLTYGQQVACDLAQTNYSSLRAGKIEFRRLCEQVQYGMLIPMLVRPIATASTPRARCPASGTPRCPTAYPTSRRRTR
jgi:capsid protein